MKLESAVVRLKGAEKNIQNGIFLEVQDGVLANASKIMNRMIELKGESDVLKNSSDNDNYNREFRNLQVQLYEMSHLTFNGVTCLRIIMRAERKQYSTIWHRIYN